MEITQPSLPGSGVHYVMTGRFPTPGFKVLCQTNVTFTINGLTMCQTFCVTDGLNRNFILGMDWLKERGVRIYFDLGMLSTGKTYVKLQEDCHISSILRLN